MVRHHESEENVILKIGNFRFEYPGDYNFRSDLLKCRAGFKFTLLYVLFYNDNELVIIFIITHIIVH